MAKGNKNKLTDHLQPNIIALGPSPEEIEQALAMKDPIQRAYRLQQMVETWKEKGADHGFINDKQFQQFIEDTAKSCASDLIVCLRETIRLVQDRLATPDDIKTSELTQILAELGRQFKLITHTTEKSHVKSESQLDEEIAALEKEVKDDLRDY